MDVSWVDALGARGASGTGAKATGSDMSRDMPRGPDLLQGGWLVPARVDHPVGKQKPSGTIMPVMLVVDHRITGAPVLISPGNPFILWLV